MRVDAGMCATYREPCSGRYTLHRLHGIFTGAPQVLIPIVAPDSYFALIVPACSLLLGLALIACWTGMPAMRVQRSVLWIAAGYVVVAVPLAAQSMMANEQLADWAVVTGAFYLAGVWAISRGMAERYGGSAHPRLAMAIAVVTLALLYYFSQISDQLWLRIMILNVAMLLMRVLPVSSIFQSPAVQSGVERILWGCYLALIANAVMRTIVVFQLMPVENIGELTRSGLWLSMLAINMVIGLAFILSLLACSVREILLTLRSERDHDLLTCLLNRRSFLEIAQVRLRSSRSPGWALLLCDVDHFKRVNDAWGHAAGDEVLQIVGQTLQQQARQNDLVARYGGEEFVVLLRCADMSVAVNVAQRMRQQLAQTHCEAIAGAVTASFGVVRVGSCDDLPRALERADALLYRAKNAGRNQVAWDAPPGRGAA
ncbi:MAG: GGDEF domain-containing protein [Comamonas sp.]